MAEFLNLLSPREALNTILSKLILKLAQEEIQTSTALGRVVAQAYYAPHPLPTFIRSTVDGYAVKAVDTFGASESLPAYLKIIGEVKMEVEAAQSISAGECVIIHTGGMLPRGADGVVMLEYTQNIQSSELEIYRAVSVGENIIQIGEDIVEGEQIIPRGVRLRPAEIGGLMAMGYSRVIVTKQPVVGIISSGDEIIQPDQELKPGQVHDINAYTLGSLIQQNGGIAKRYGIVRDDLDSLSAMARQAISECEMIIITAGSSASTRDLTSAVIQKLGKPGVLVHGVNIKPGKPTILGICDQKPAIGLPGNPVSALVIAQFFVVPIIEHLLGLQYPRPRSQIAAYLETNLASQAGREDWIAVKVTQKENGFSAAPIFGKSNLIFTLVRADGLVRIPADVTGIEAGSLVEVLLF